MNSCWSCLTVIENGEKTCPLCGADQAALPPLTEVETAIVVNKTPLMLRWGVPAGALFCLLGAAAWYTKQADYVDPHAQGESAATNALENIRLALSLYAMSQSDQYPPTLDPLATQAAVPEQDAKIEGYSLVYRPIPSPNDGAIRGFTLLARPEKTDYRNFYIDQSGVLHATEQNRPAGIDDPPI